MKNSIYLLSTAILLFAGGCTHSHDDEHNHGDDPHDHEEDSHPMTAETPEDEVHMTQKQLNIMGVEIRGFEMLNLSTTVKSNGQLELPPQNKATVSAVMGGHVKSVAIQEGNAVRKGQTLLTLEHPDFLKMQQDFMVANSNIEFLEKDYERKVQLSRDSIGSIKSLQKAKADYHSALANLNGLKAQLEMLQIDVSKVEKGIFVSAIPVMSPIDGFVRHIEINLGSFVQPEQKMAEIVDNKNIHIDLMIYENDMNKVKVDQKVIFSLSNNPDSLFQGTIFATGKSFEREPKAMVVHARIESTKGNLLPGMFVNARIITNESNVRALPNDAIVSDGGLDYIFLLESSPEDQHDHAEHESEEEGHSDEYVFHKLGVKVGASDIGFTEVIPIVEVPINARIVTKGAFYLLAEMNKGRGGHGHAH
jgi:cobalt-zinc-cadmium efflux system membrane fusion protein